MTGSPVGYLFSLEAEADLYDIWTYLANKQGEASADRVVAHIYEECERIASFPGIGHYRDDIPVSHDYKFHSAWNYLIVFRWQAVPIQIVCLVHGARDLPLFFDERPPLG